MKIPLRQYWNLLSGYLRPQRRNAVWLTLLLLGSIGLQLVNPQIMRYFIDTAQAGGASETLFTAALLFIGIALTHQVVSVVATYVSENVAWTATNALRADLADHCLRLDMSFHSAHTPGEMIERIDGDVTTLSNFFSQFVIQVVGNALLLIGVLVFLFREDWRVGLTLTGFSLVALLVLTRFRNIAVPHWTAERQCSAELFGFLEERLTGTEDIRSNGAEAYVMHHFHRLMRTLLNRSLKAGLMVNVLLNAMFLLFALGNAVAFAVGAWLFETNAVTIGAVYIIFHYTTMLERPITQITRQLEDLQKASAGMVRVLEILGIHSRLEDTGSSLGLPPGPLAVDFEAVSFGYETVGAEVALDAAQGNPADHARGPQPAKEMVLHDLSFQLPAGTVLGLLGRTGSGKTTLTRLLFRLYDPDTGSVRLGDAVGSTDVGQVSLAALRRRVGMVTQNIQLFHATVRDNLTLFDGSIPDARILRIVQELGLWEWYEALPDGLDTVLESGGGGLSA